MESNCCKFDELAQALESATAQAQAGDSASAMNAARLGEDLRYHVANCSACREANISLLPPLKSTAA